MELFVMNQKIATQIKYKLKIYKKIAKSIPLNLEP